MRWLFPLALLLAALPSSAAGQSTSSLWAPSDSPATSGGAAENLSVELGLRFSATEAGQITALRYYRTVGDPATSHTGNLWTGTGTLLASATYTGETASGWQQVTLPTPVQIAANTEYVTSYHGVGFGLTRPYSWPRLNGSLRGIGSHFAYGPGPSLYPNQPMYMGSNYWADVVFEPAAAALTPTPTATGTILPTQTPTPPSPTATPVPSGGPGGVTDPALAWSPYTWRDAGSYRESNPQNASVEFEFQAASLSVDLDTTAYAGISQSNWPKLQWSVDLGPWSATTTAASGADLGSNVRRLAIAGGLSSGVWHHVRLWTSSTAVASHWTVLQQRIRRFVRSDGSALLATRAPTYTWPKNLLVFGDSIAQFGGGDIYPTPGQFIWPVSVARALRANIGLIAYEGQGWRVAGTGGGAAFHVPGFVDGQSWRWYSNGQTRLDESGKLIGPPPDYVLVNLGTNDQFGAISPASVQAAATDWLVQVRAAAGPQAQIFVLVPFGQWYRAELVAAVAASGDARAHLIDPGPEQARGLSGFAVLSPSWRSVDSVHPNVGEQAEIAARVTAAIRDALQGALP